MLEALQIMLAEEDWLSKAMQALFRPDIFEDIFERRCTQARPRAPL